MKKEHLIMLTALIIVTVGWYFGFLRPVYTERQTVKDEIANTSAQIADFERIFKDLPAFFDSQKELVRQKHQLMSQLASKGDLLRLFSEFETLAKNHQLRLIEITPSIDELLILNRAAVGDTLPQILPISLSLNGKYPDIGKFVGDLEKANFYKGLTFCRITNDVDGRATSDITFTFNAILGIAGKS
ncbi:MAG: type 4a pilus biogenesis protein PilO [candidate division Zixibacteria bacterium]|nr:type 4a pilus biogenesis protein PilO [candidate division Zixibacteria bacterium]